ncbi:hypothetical protein GGR12_002468 [Brevundimonas lenta]|uniref:Uncharacterized protein n=1 Tax=Brevundimonas lenta TaxID=424796 RepID=A0A7W6JEF5_9CAUL|nr:hypothetical protein [Brevundimonas lenta]
MPAGRGRLKPRSSAYPDKTVGSTAAGAEPAAVAADRCRGGRAETSEPRANDADEERATVLGTVAPPAYQQGVWAYGATKRERGRGPRIDPGSARTAGAAADECHGQFPRCPANGRAVRNHGPTER